MASDGDSSRARYDRFVEFERLMHVYPSGAISPSNPTPLGFCAFALTLFVYSFIMCGATVPIGTYAGPAMGLALFYGGLIQLIAGLLEFRSGNNFYALTFCSYGGYWFSLAALYVTGSFAFLSNPLTTPTAMPTNDVYKSLGIFYLGWTIFTLAMLISSVRSNVVLIVFFFFLMLTYILLTASYFLSAHQDLARAGGAIGIFTSVIAWFLGFASLLRKGDNSYFNLPNYSLAPRTNAAAEGPVAKHKP